MVLPSLADALIVIVLLIPGFIAFWVTKRVGKFNRPLTEFETSVWSFVFSAVILFIFTLVTNLSDLDKIRQEFFDPKIFGVLFVITGIIGLGGGAIFNLSNRISDTQRTLEQSQAYALKLNYVFTKKVMEEESKLEKLHTDGNISDEKYEEEVQKLDEKRKKTILTVFTKDNLQFSGYLLHVTEDSWDILIGKAYDNEQWEKLLIKGDDITRIFFFSD
jgi:hypothetical protein